jgi:hypothetical protein
LPLGRIAKHAHDRLSAPTLRISIIFPVSMLIYSNSRISDAKKTLRAEMAELRNEMRQRFERMELLLKMHEAEHHHK